MSAKPAPAGTISKAYAERIGAEYRFDHNPNIAGRTISRRLFRRQALVRYYECLNMLVDDAFLQYDNVLVLDMDIFAVDGLQESIFDADFGDLGICTEPSQTRLHAIHPNKPVGQRNHKRWEKALREKWNINLPRTDAGWIKIYNSGVILFSRQGLLKARERFVSFNDYIFAMRQVGGWLPPMPIVPHCLQRLPRFYWFDQHYLHAMMLYARLDYTELHNGWNSYIQWSGQIDERTAETRLVHIQIRGSEVYDADTLHRITNLPQAQWRIRK